VESKVNSQLEAEIWKSLEQIFDPEIPVISVIDLGIISDVIEDETGHITINIMPTFSGCPAIKLIASDVEAQAKKITHKDNITVFVDKYSGWNTNRITDKGRQILKDFGLSPPKRYVNELEVESILQNAVCPNCNSDHTAMRTPFGSTLCRSMHFCYECNQAFEQFKPI
jgi:ring-1,2-phenylacetyl-CoA epoxidase subunit PaaD